MIKAISVASLEQVPFGNYLMDLKTQLNLDKDTEEEFWKILKEKTQKFKGQQKEIPVESTQNIENPEIKSIIDVIMANLKGQ